MMVGSEREEGYKTLKGLWWSLGKLNDCLQLNSLVLWGICHWISDFLSLRVYKFKF